MKGVNYRTFKECILFKFKISYDKQLFDFLILFIKNILDHKRLTNAIIDLRSVKGDIPFMDRFNLGKSIAATLPGKYKLAVIAEESKITKFGETVAVNRGANFFVSHDMKGIKEWFKK